MVKIIARCSQNTDFSCKTEFGIVKAHYEQL